MNFATTSASSDALSPSVRKTLSNTFWSVGAMMAITGGAAFSSLDLKLGLGALLGLFVASLLVMFATMAFRTSAFGLVLLAVFAGIQGVVLGPLLSHYLAMKGGTNIVATSAGLTALAAFACATYAMTSRKDFSRLGGFLLVATLLLLVGMLISLFLPIPGLHLALSVAGAVIFTAWLLFDIGAVVNGQETNYISAALGIYLDVLNLFMHILRLVGALSDD